ncbi:hypothetical protein BO78DRAFT_431924 [Aspergillus sclerotiicarbonarius CBS 121057]|uniref:Uncharacterized protein n=1 Tax=Aspergillus sclerotiicarbonarius (strain CBS 121057 / IBT 28362) TaxID=1448318 RepID=A0A319ES40_ASPSB|nr:hypothetical protein BO78DRAFT_431924 [Aspergillus sclerotiicarbonarius CBS 121057]
MAVSALCRSPLGGFYRRPADLMQHLFEPLFSPEVTLRDPWFHPITRSAHCTGLSPHVRTLGADTGQKAGSASLIMVVPSAPHSQGAMCRGQSKTSRALAWGVDHGCDLRLTRQVEATDRLVRRVASFWTRSIPCIVTLPTHDEQVAIGSPPKVSA